MALIGTNADFSQNDPRWRDQLLGFSTWEKLGPFGCGVTAAANIFQAQGADFDPSTVNEALKARGLFVRDSYGQIADFAGYAAFGAVSGHTHFIEQQNWPGTQVAPAAYFDVRDTLDTEVMAMIDYHPELAGVQTHFVRVIGLNPAKNDVEVVDSFTGKRIWLSSLSSRVGKNGLAIIWSAGRYKRV